MTSIITSLLTRAHAFIRRYWNKQSAIALTVIVVFLSIGVVKAMLTNETAESEKPRVHSVTVAPAGFSGELQTVLEASGEVKSHSQGDLRTQRAGIITSVSASVGQSVSAGTIIASVENASERASVAQAQAGVAQAQANLNKVSGGTREEQLAVLSATTANAQDTLDAALTSVRNTLLSAYVTTDATFAGGVDTLFDDADSPNPQLEFPSKNNNAVLSAEHSRFLLQSTIERHKAESQRVQYYDAQKARAELEVLEADMLKIKSALDSIISALDGAFETTTVTNSLIVSYKTTATTARANVISTLSSLSTARSSLNAAQNALTIAEQNEAQGVTGAQEEDIATAQAQFDSAQASLSQAYAQLENTRVRAPVSGVITVLSVAPGDFVSAYQDVGLVASSGALEVEAYVSPNVVARLFVGGSATIDKKYEGVITSIAPGIDPTTRQVQVKVALVDTKASIPNGSRVSIAFLNVSKAEENPSAPLLIPISALKLIGDTSYVFIVENDAVVPIEVTLGGIVQSSVEIIDGITRDTRIVIDARGLNEGDEVTVAN